MQNDAGSSPGYLNRVGRSWPLPRTDVSRFRTHPWLLMHVQAAAEASLAPEPCKPTLEP